MENTFDLTEAIALDAARSRKTAEGYLVAAPLVARTGIQLYQGEDFGRPELKEVRLYRPENEVFSRDSLSSYAHIPVTNNHPPAMVDAANWKQHAVGQTGDEVARDGERIRIPMMVLDAKAVSAIEAGKRELSMGYRMTIDWTAGETPKGEKYDAVAKDIRCNHIAIVDAARGGPELRIADEARQQETSAMDNQQTTTCVIDGISFPGIPAIAAQAFDKFRLQSETSLKSVNDALAVANGKVKELTDAAATATTESKKAIDEKDGKIAGLEKQLADAQAAATPAAMDARVKDRAALIQKAKKVLPGVVTDGKTDGEIRRQVVDAKIGTSAQGKSDEWVSAAFDGVAASAGSSRDPIRDAVQNYHAEDGRPDQNTVAGAYDTMVEDLESAWKGEQPAQSRPHQGRA